MTQVLYAALAGGDNTTSDLYTVDPTTGNMASIGAIGDAISDFAFDPTDGTLYGVTSRLNTGPNGTGALVIIDTSTGAPTPVPGGTIGGGRIAFDSTGQLWSTSTSGEFVQIDKTNGDVTVINAASDYFSGGLDFDGSGVLWLVGAWTGSGPHIGTIDTGTGLFTEISDPSDGNFDHSGKFDQDGVMWCANGAETRHAGQQLVTVDLVTGAVTVIGPFSILGVGALAWGGAATPTLRANFTGTPLHGSAPLSVTFTDASTPGPSGPITGWDLDYGDGTSHDSGPGPWPHSYVTPGLYTVILTVTGTSPDGTATKTRTNYILVHGPETLYAALAGPETTSDLYTVDPATAVLTPIGPIGDAVSGLAMDPTSGILYGATSANSAANPHRLITIDLATGAATIIGNFHGGFTTVHDIAFDASGQLWGWDASGGVLGRIDKTNGTVTAVGSFTTSYQGGLDFDSGGTLWKVGYVGSKIGTVNTTTGALTFLRNTSPAQSFHSGKFDFGDVFWASDRPHDWPSANHLVTVDVGTGTVTTIAAFSVANVGALAWVFDVVLVPDFLVHLTPTAISGPQGGYAVDVALSTTALNGDTETITLSATAPPGITVAYGTNPITAGNGTTVHVTVGPSVAAGTYTVTIHANGTGNSHDAVLTVHVYAPGTAPGVAHIAS